MLSDLQLFQGPLGFRLMTSRVGFVGNKKSIGKKSKRYHLKEPF